MDSYFTLFNGMELLYNLRSMTADVLSLFITTALSYNTTIEGQYNKSSLGIIFTTVCLITQYTYGWSVQQVIPWHYIYKCVSNYSMHLWMVSKAANDVTDNIAIEMVNFKKKKSRGIKYKFYDLLFDTTRYRTHDQTLPMRARKPLHHRYCILQQNMY